jgi:PleD family two-component response regulator
VGLGSRPDGNMVTASFGIVDRQDANVGDWSALVDIADNQMYDVKSRGGNDISFYHPEENAELDNDADNLAAAE